MTHTFKSTLAAVAVIAISATAGAQTSHSDCSGCAAHSRPVGYPPISQLPTTYASDRSTGGTGGCCSDGACSLTSATATRSTPQRLEQLSLDMHRVLQSELQGHRDYRNLMRDAEDAVRAARRLNDAEAARVSTSVLLDESQRLLAPLRRINSAVRDDRRSEESYRAVQQVGRLLVSWNRDLEGGVPAGVGARSRSSQPSASIRIPSEMKGVALLPPSEQEAALRQRICPVTQEPLGSMGKPLRVSVAGRSVFVCCQGCVSALQRNPQKYLQNLAGSTSRPAIDSYYPPIPRGTVGTASIPEEMKGVRLLPASEQAVALRQRTCPVIGEPLGSMGKPIRVDVAGRSVYVCCQGCVNAVQRNPQKYIRG